MTSSRVVAVIDVGSNSVRLLVARQLTASAFEVVDEEKLEARLGEGHAGGQLTPAGMDRGLRALRIMAQVADSHSPSAIAAVGTEALRRAENAGEFIARARLESGLAVRVLSPAEEAFASFLGTINSTGLRDGYLVDVGGGSLEVIRVEGRGLADSRSVPLGAIYATERYFRSDPPSAKDVRALRKAVRASITVSSGPPVLYGVGGAARNLARIVRLQRQYPLRRLHGFTIARRELSRLTRALTTRSADERRRIPGLASSRLDILPAAAVVIDEVMEMVGAPELHISGQGLREGIAWQELRGDRPILGDVRGASIAGLARANGVDELSSEPVVSAAAALFEATAARHRLGPEWLDLLLAGARLAGIGLHVDYYNRDRHAEYLVHSGDLHGFSHREVVLLGALVRAGHGGSADLAAYRSLVLPTDAADVTLLGAMLGVARAVRRRTPSPVLRFEPRLDGGTLHLQLAGKGGLDAELYDLEREAKRLETALKLQVVLRLSD
ncbi:MAG: Ppx/GppA family phosphatase [Chloroflexi bacterium]|nr:Ppx/GppA family phosphatase [Chloroflexota bacterium]